MAWKNHRRRIRAYRNSGRMFADSISCGGSSNLAAERDRLAVRFRELGLVGSCPDSICLFLLRQMVSDAEEGNGPGTGCLVYALLEDGWQRNAYESIADALEAKGGFSDVRTESLFTKTW